MTLQGIHTGPRSFTDGVWPTQSYELNSITMERLRARSNTNGGCSVSKRCSYLTPFHSVSCRQDRWLQGVCRRPFSRDIGLEAVEEVSLQPLDHSKIEARLARTNHTFL